MNNTIFVALLVIILIIIIIVIFKIASSATQCGAKIYNAAKKTDIYEKYLTDKDKKLKDKEQERDSDINQTMQNHTNIPFNDGAEIVDIVEPKGFWTKKIIKEKLDYLKYVKHLLQNKNSNEETKKMGYWQLMIYAQGHMKGKGKGRGK